MSRDLNAIFGADAPRASLPDMPELAFVLAGTFTALGGSFTIGSNGQRYMGRPTGALFQMNGEGLPQLPTAELHQRFHHEAEWEGALKMLDVLIAGLSIADRNFVFDAFAPVAVDERKLLPSIEEPKRRAA